jgi:hypothetical protein
MNLGVSYKFLQLRRREVCNEVSLECELNSGFCQVCLALVLITGVEIIQ